MRFLFNLFAAQPAPKRKTLHFLHIGKNAGTEIIRYIDRINLVSADLEIVRHGHDVFMHKLCKVNENPGYFFSIRNPISRFKSAFYGRKRQGKPRYERALWSSDEALAFKEFDHATELAEALFRRDDLGRKALAAVKSIRHTAQNQTDWFYCFGHFLDLKPPIAIIRQENFKEDMINFQRKINLPDPFLLNQDAVLSHSNNYDGTPDLSPTAVENLMRWYCQDIAFYEMCEDWIVRGGNSPPT